MYFRDSAFERGAEAGTDDYQYRFTDALDIFDSDVSRRKSFFCTSIRRKMCSITRTRAISMEELTVTRPA